MPSNATSASPPQHVGSTAEFDSALDAERSARDGDEAANACLMTPNAEVSGERSESAGLPGYAAGGNGERK